MGVLLEEARLLKENKDQAQTDDALLRLQQAQTLIRETGYKRREKELRELWDAVRQ